MTEDKRKKIITGCIIAGMVVLIIVLTTVILKVKKTKVGTADKTDPAEYSSSDITSKETESITPLAKAKEALIILSLFFVFINTGIIPSRVDKPAIPVIKNEKYNLFMINTMLNLEKNAKLC